MNNFFLKLFCSLINEKEMSNFEQWQDNFSQKFPFNQNTILHAYVLKDLILTDPL